MFGFGVEQKIYSKAKFLCQNSVIHQDELEEELKSRRRLRSVEIVRRKVDFFR
jgi:hypothetical protein